MPAIYRVEKDGITFHVQPEMLGYYADNGYAIYKQVEQAVTDVEREARAAVAETTGSTTTIGE